MTVTDSEAEAGRSAQLILSQRFSLARCIFDFAANICADLPWGVIDRRSVVKPKITHD